jgi:hypothetical protein
MTGDLDAEAGRTLMEVSKQADVRKHPFDWWDSFLVMMPIAVIVFAIWSEAEG